MLFWISFIYWNLKLKDDKNQTKIEQKTIIVPTLLIKSLVLSKTSLATYFALGVLYSGSSNTNELVLFLKTNFLKITPLIKMSAIAKKYNEAVTNPLQVGKNAPTNNEIIGNFALQGTNGVRTVEIILSSLFSIVLVELIAGTEQAVPTINGTKDFPLNPNFLNNLSNINEILDI